MHPVASPTPLPLRYEHICDRSRLDCLDEEMLVETLSTGEDGPAPELSRRSIAGHSNLLIARMRGGQDPIAILGYDVREITGVPVFLCGTAYVRRDYTRHGVMRRLLAAGILKTAGLSHTPRAMAARLIGPGLREAMTRIAARFEAATVYPVRDGTPIPLHTASLARAIARDIAPHIRHDLATSTLRGSLAVDGTVVRQVHASFIGRSFRPCDEVLGVIDLRAMTDETITDTARRIVRSR